MSLNPLSLVSSVLGGAKTYLIVGAIAALLAGSAGAYAGYRWEHSALLNLQLADQRAVTAAIQKAADRQEAEDAVALQAAVGEAKAQTTINERVVTLVRKVPVYVPQVVDHPCLPVGLIRLLDAAASEADPASLQLAPGQSDDTCADIDVDTLADQIIGWIATDQGNAKQLTDLQAWVQADHIAQEANK